MSKPHHRIRSLQVTGGFLKGLELDFSDGLNCIIGGRGTGKTTVLEALRFVLDRLPNVLDDRVRNQNIMKLLEGNLPSGSVKVQIETSDGSEYGVSRGFGEEPLVTNAEGKAVDIRIGSDMHFGVDIYSQNQIEDIASSDYFQLQLLDRFIQSPLEEIERQIRETTNTLEANGQRILEAKKKIDDYTEATRELPDIAEKIKSYEKTDGKGQSDEMRKAHEAKSLREREMKFLESLSGAYQQSATTFSATMLDIRRRFAEVLGQDLSTSPNRDVVSKAREGAQLSLEKVQTQLDIASKLLGEASTDLKQTRAALAERQSLQEQQYRALLDKDEQERAKGLERTRIEQRHTDLVAKQKVLVGAKAELEKQHQERNIHRSTLSDLRDQRYRLRVEVAETLNDALKPMIRVQVQQFGNREQYKTVLNQAMKGSGLRYATIVDRAAERLPPAEFASAIQKEDQETLIRELEIEADRATRLIIQLKDKPEIFSIETVELRDRPILELKDGDDYKDSSTLSTGQKCTTILPILLVESERPLLIDQPEDNLDNAFVFETVVKSVSEAAKKRQLIFVTHNPNIPVLGDAARVFALRSSGRSATLANAGTVDDVAQEIVTILEGGRVAFEARRERYGRPVPKSKTK